MTYTPNFFLLLRVLPVTEGSVLHPNLRAVIYLLLKRQSAPSDLVPLYNSAAWVSVLFT
jgi:hypothetical protein